MRLFTLAAMAVTAASFGLGTAGTVRAAAPIKLSGPYQHENLTVYFMHGASAGGSIPLTLSEALSKGQVQVRETGSVNNLEIENSGNADVFIQAGDIVKGGQQDRVLIMSMILPAYSGAVPIGSFCVEQGRWSKRGVEDVKHFASSADALPSREAKLAMKAPAKAAPSADLSAGSDVRPSRPNASIQNDTGKRQQEMWAAVAGMQSKLTDRLGAPVAEAQSATSLQLSLENTRLKASRAAYIADLEGKATDADIVGYVFAVNGKINSADQYPSNGLFKKMWPKLLAASATEAIGEAAKFKAGEPASAGSSAAPSLAEVEAFLAQAETGAAQDKPLGKLASQRLRDGDTALYVEARRADGAWVHRNYLAK